MTGILRSLLRAAGKSETKVAAVFAYDAASAHAAVLHLRRGAPDVPVWLFSQSTPLGETTSLCERLHIHRSSLALFFEAQRELWPYWVAIAVTAWTGGHGRWPLKLAPFLLPPFRALVLNQNGDFLPGTPRNVLRHSIRRVRDGLTSGGNRARDLGRAYWLLVSYHIWRSGPVTRFKDEAAGVSLWMASLLLRGISPLHGPLFYRIFDRFRGREPLYFPDLRATGEGVVRFCQNGPHWSAGKLDQLVRSSGARWLLWREDERSHDAIEDMLPLFDDPHTFAVSRQVYVRGWKPVWLATAPFRTLQRGEASSVAAPLSDCILVDASKLLALGIPSASLGGTAWMILFCKASAAGWHSYSVGRAGGPLREQPNLPMQETGFLLRFLLSGELRRVGPRAPELSRGAIAFPIRRDALQPEPRGDRPRLTVLLVSPFLPYPLSHGGAVRMWNLCRALSGRVDFILAAIREKDDSVDYEKLSEVFREVYIIDNDERALRDDRLPQQVRTHQSGSLRALIAEIADRRRPDVLQIEYTHMAAFRDAAPHIPAILVEHDLTFSLYRQLAAKSASPEAEREYRRWLDFETRWLAAYDTVWTVSEEDRDAAVRASGRSPSRTFNIPNGVDIERYVPRDEPTSAPEIFYVGSFRHLPNVIGFEKLRDEVMPRVWRERPDVHLRVVAGPRHEDFYQHPGFDSRVEIHGFVEDLRPLYAKAAIVVVPLEVSAGTNIKVLEAMACGKPVVTTPVGCAGLGLRDRYDAFIDADWNAFARSILELISDDTLRGRVAAQARRTAAEQFSWTAIASAAYESYRALTSGVPAEPRP
jgi:glycosyltransferase involved in cell wall biosynthesis